ITMESDITKPEGGHYNHDPVQAGYPAVLLPLPHHDGVKCHCIEKHERYKCGKEPAQKFNITLCLPVPKKIGELYWNKFHVPFLWHKSRPCKKNYLTRA